jgi:hypothetical protein
MYMYTGFCILSILWKQKEENIDVHVYWVLYSQYSLETDRRKHRCKSILGSVCFQRILTIQNPVYMYIYVFFYLFLENTENTEPSIHVHLCFHSVSREYWEYRTQYTCTPMISSFCFQKLLRIQNPVYMYTYDGYWVLYCQFSLETERRKHRCTCILGSVFSVFSRNR